MSFFIMLNNYFNNPTSVFRTYNIIDCIDIKFKHYF